MFLLGYALSLLPLAFAMSACLVLSMDIGKWFNALSLKVNVALFEGSGMCFRPYLRLVCGGG